MKKKYLTLDDLYLFCKQNDFASFSANEFGGPIVVHSFGKFEADDVEDADLIPVKLQACHTLENRNKSYISDKVMKKALPSFANKPILGYIHQLENGEWDFYTHNMSYVADEESEDGVRVEYDERPIGVIPESCNAHLSYDKEKQKNYVVVNGYNYSLYGNRAIDIIRKNGGQTKVSVEIAVNEMSFNAKEDYLEITDFEFLGVTCLGKTPDGEVVEEGMQGANLQLENFTAKQNSMFGDEYAKIVDLLSNINDQLGKLSYNKFEQKGVESEMSHFEELLEKYGKSVEDITFEYEGMSDEDLDAKFAELFDEGESAGEGEAVGESEGEASGDGDEDGESESVAEEESEPTEDETEPEVIGDAEEIEPVVEDENEEETDMEEDGDEDGVPEKKKKDEFAVINFKISHEDTRYALQNLLNNQNTENSYYVVNSVYDDFFYYEDWYSGEAFKQYYKTRKDVISLNGDPVPVYREFVTAEEKTELENMRKNYAALVEFKAQYDANVLKVEKEKVFSDDAYAGLADNEEFKSLKEHMDEFSVEEIKVKADLIFAKYAKSKLAFAADAPVAQHSVGVFNPSAKAKKKRAYARLFDE